MANIGYAIERLRRRQRLRYWALALPVLILALALPLLRPLRHPDPRAVADDEWVRIESIRQLATTGSFALDAGRVENRVNILRSVGGVAGSEESGSGRDAGGRGASGTGGASEGLRGVRGNAREGDGGRVVLAAQEPMLTLIGAGVFHGLRVAGVAVGPEYVLGPYLLTLILSTIPTAVTATLIYRCGRLLELPRLRRIALAFACITCTGLLPFAAVLSPYPLAAMCVTGALACLAHVLTIRPLPGGWGWLLLGGFLAGVGAAVHPSVAALGAILGLTPLVLPSVSWGARIGAVLLFSVGTLPALGAHRVMMQMFIAPSGAETTLMEGTRGAMVSTRGATLGTGGAMVGTVGAIAVSDAIDGWTVPVPVIDPRPDGLAMARVAEEDESPAEVSVMSALGSQMVRVLRILFGQFGVISHYPAVLVAGLAVLVMFTRHWPDATRRLALACLLGFLAPLVVWIFGAPRGGERMYGPQPLVAVGPVLFLWVGIFLRAGWSGSRDGGRSMTGWTLAVFSFSVGLIGLLHPYRRGGFSMYPPYEVIKESLLDRTSATTRPSLAAPTLLAAPALQEGSVLQEGSMTRPVGRGAASAPTSGRAP